MHCHVILTFCPRVILVRAVTKSIDPNSHHVSWVMAYVLRAELEYFQKGFAMKLCDQNFSMYLNTLQIHGLQFTQIQFRVSYRTFPLGREEGTWGLHTKYMCLKLSIL